MDPQTACDLCRVRLLALRALVAAGGRPRPGQWRRAVAPLVDAGLGQVELTAIGDALGAHVGVDQVQRGGQVDRAHVGCGAAGRGDREKTVQNTTDVAPWE